MTGAKETIGINRSTVASELQMREGKPANDGAVPDHRRYRAVHIQILRDFCALSGSAT